MPYMIYPERREVTAEQVLSWAQDEICTQAVKRESRHLGRPLTEQEADAAIDAALASDEAHMSLEGAIEYLEDLGLATFREGRA